MIQFHNIPGQPQNVKGLLEYAINLVHKAELLKNTRKAFMSIISIRNFTSRCTEIWGLLRVLKLPKDITFFPLSQVFFSCGGYL